MFSSFFKGPFASVGCSFEEDGWVTTDLRRGQRVKWVPAVKQTFRWDVIDNQWLPSTESRSEFLLLAREYRTSVRQKR
jgi:hypothetical protein